MKTKEKKTKKRLPRFKSTTLRQDDLKGVSGGMMSRCTGGTRSVCHIDGTDDGDYLA